MISLRIRPKRVLAAERVCKNCGAPLQDSQDWCLSCGAGRPGSLASPRGLRAGASALALAALLVVGASVAAYAALTKPSPKPHKTLAARPPVGTIPATPTVPGGTTTTPTTPTVPGTPTTVKPAAPNIPLQTPTPKASEPPDSALFPPETGKEAGKGGGGGGGKSSNGSSGSGGGSGSSGQGKEAAEVQEGGGGSGGEPPSPLLLDTNAASTYNPYGYAATMFGDPSLAIDGESATAWTATVDPAKAPNMAEGLVLDLKTPQKLRSAAVRSAPVGTTIEMYGAVGQAPPPSITDPAWKRLSGAKVLKKKDSTVKLKTAGKGYRYILLWLAKAPAGAGTVAIHELELFAVE